MDERGANRKSSMRTSNVKSLSGILTLVFG